jgi:beta-glucosidase-like glycosyl hydrolase
VQGLGVNVNLAPVADINNNPMNPVINYRSFGEKRENVTSKALMFMKGMQDNGILAVLKHFPGHGDTNTDSHLDLPLITHPRSRLDSLELFPFLNLITEGAGSVMTAHLNLPSLDSTSKLPSTLSPVIINELLKKEMGFKGLVITDAMNMKGVTKYFNPGEAEAQAIIAGNDVVEFVTDVDAAIKAIRKSVAEKKLTSGDIDSKCRKILALKYWSGLNKPHRIAIENISKEVSPPATVALIRDLYSRALTVLNNKENILPIKNLRDLKIAAIAINRKDNSVFLERLRDYYPVDTFYISPEDDRRSGELIDKLAGYDLVIAGVFNTDQRPKLEDYDDYLKRSDAALFRSLQSMACKLSGRHIPMGWDNVNFGGRCSLS